MGLSNLKFKKGSIMDIFTIMVFLVVFAVFIIFGKMIVNEFASDPVLTNNSYSKSALDTANSGMSGFDNLFLFVLIMLMVGSIIMAFMIRTHPVFFFIALFLLVFALVVAGILGKTMDTFTDDSQISSTTAQFPKMMLVLDNLPIFILVSGILIMISMYMGFKVT